MVKASCGWQVAIDTRADSKMTDMKDSEHIIVSMGDTDKGYMFKVIFKGKAKSHIRTAAFKSECLSIMNFRVM